jgi:hypothetical protein
MRKVLFHGVVVGLLLGLATRAPAQEAQAIIDKAIKAHGGEEKLKTLMEKGAQSKSKGKLELLGGVDVTVEAFIQFPDNKFKSVMQLNINGMNVTTTQVFNGDKFWLNVNGQDLSNLLDDKALAEVKEQLYLERAAVLVFLKDKSVELSPLGEGKHDGKDVVGVRVSSKGHRDVSLWFDKGSGLLTKIEHRVLDFMSKEEKSQEKVLLDYKDTDGYLRPTKVIINQDGKKFMEMDVLEAKVVDRFDDSVFAKP